LREMTPEQQTTLEQLARSPTAEARLVQRAQILLGLRGGERPGAVARRLGVPPPHRLRLGRPLQRGGVGRVAGPAAVGPSPSLPRRPTGRADRRGTDPARRSGAPLGLLDAGPAAGVPP